MSESVVDFDAIREALAAHFVMWHELLIGGHVGEWRCACGVKFGFSDTAIDHVADVIARLAETPQELNRCPGSLRPPRHATATDSTVGDVGICQRCGRWAKLRRDGVTKPHESRQPSTPGAPS